MSVSTPTVLVVEDEESFVEALQIGLRREGFRVEVARDGQQALDMFDIVNPDHHGHREGRGDRHRCRPGGRRR